MKETNYSRAKRLWAEAHDQLSRDGFVYWLCAMYGAMEAYNAFPSKVLDVMEERIATLKEEEGRKT